MSQQAIAAGFAKNKAAASRQADERRQREKEEIVRTIIRNQKKKQESNALDDHAEADAEFWGHVKEKMLAEVVTTKKHPHRKSKFDVKMELDQLTLSEVRAPDPTFVHRAYACVVPPAFQQWLAKSVPYFHPTSRLHVVWDIFVALLICYSVVLIPVRVGFGLSLNTAAVVCNVITDSLFGLDILIYANTAVIGDDNVLITDRIEIFRLYLRGWFAIDILSTIPIDGLVGLFMGGGSSSSLKVLRLLRLARLTKLARVLKLGKVMANVDTDAIPSSVTTLGTAFSKIFFVAHLFACFWYFITSDVFPPNETNWVEQSGVGDASISMKYVTALYWTTATMMSVGYGDVHAFNSGERIYSVVTMLAGSISIGAMVGAVSSVVAANDARGKAYKAKMVELKAYLNSREEVSKSLKETVKEAYRYYLSKRSVFNERDMSLELPSSLRNEIILKAYEDVVGRVLFFQGEDDSYVSYLVLFMKPYMCSPNETFIEEGDIADDIAFLIRGFVSMRLKPANVDTKAASELVIAGYVKEGEMMGDFGFTTKTARMCSYVAERNYIDVVSISREDFESANAMYVISSKHFLEETKLRLDEFKVVFKSADARDDRDGTLTKTMIMVGGRAVRSDGQPTLVETVSILKVTTKSVRRRPSTVPALTASLQDMGWTGIENVPAPARERAFSDDGSTVATPTPPMPQSNSSTEATDEASLSEKSSTLEKAVRRPSGGVADEQLELLPPGDDSRKAFADRLIIDPGHPFKVKWDLLIGFLIIYSIIAIPYTLCFDVPQNAFLDVQDIIFYIFFTMDIFIAFRTAFEDPKTELLIVSPKSIAKNYLKGWFVIDFGSVFPFEALGSFIVTHMSGGGQNTSVLGALGLLKVVRLIRLVRLVRVLKLARMIEAIEDTWEINPVIFELLQLFFGVTFIGHLFGCFFYFVSVETTPPEHSWYGSLTGLATIPDKYIAGVYWAFTSMTTVGYGDIMAISLSEKWYAIFCMFVGASIFASIVSSIATMMNNFDLNSARQDARLAGTDDFLKEKELSKGVSKGIKNHLNFAMECKSAFDEADILKKLPRGLARRLFFESHGEELKMIMLFTYVERSGVVMYVYNMLKPALFPDGHLILKEGNASNEIFFVVGGHAAMCKAQLRLDGSAELVTDYKIGPGQCMGYYGKITDTGQTHSAIACNSCKLYYVNIMDINNISYDNPVIAKYIAVALGQCFHDQEILNARNGFKRPEGFDVVQRRTSSSSPRRATVSSSSSEELFRQLPQATVEADEEEEKEDELHLNLPGKVKSSKGGVFSSVFGSSKRKGDRKGLLEQEMTTQKK